MVTESQSRVPCSYTEHSPTALSINGLQGEPENSEFCIQSNDDQRVESYCYVSCVYSNQFLGENHSDKGTYT